MRQNALGESHGRGKDVFPRLSRKVRESRLFRGKTCLQTGKGEGAHGTFRANGRFPASPKPPGLRVRRFDWGLRISNPEVSLSKFLPHRQQNSIPDPSTRV